MWQAKKSPDPKKGASFRLTPIKALGYSLTAKKERWEKHISPAKTLQPVKIWQPRLYFLRRSFQAVLFLRQKLTTSRHRGWAMSEKALAGTHYFSSQRRRVSFGNSAKIQIGQPPVGPAPKSVKLVTNWSREVGLFTGQRITEYSLVVFLP